MKRVGVFLIAVGLITGMTTCQFTLTRQYDLTVAGTAGGWVAAPT